MNRIFMLLAMVALSTSTFAQSEMTLDEIRVVERVYLDKYGREFRLQSIIPASEAGSYQPEGEDPRLGQPPTSEWVLAKIDVGRPRFEYVNNLTVLGVRDAQTIWQHERYHVLMLPRYRLAAAILWAREMCLLPPSPLPPPPKK